MATVTNMIAAAAIMGAFGLTKSKRKPAMADPTRCRARWGIDSAQSPRPRVGRRRKGEERDHRRQGDARADGEQGNSQDCRKQKWRGGEDCPTDKRAKFPPGTRFNSPNRLTIGPTSQICVPPHWRCR